MTAAIKRSTQEITLTTVHPRMYRSNPLLFILLLALCLVVVGIPLMAIWMIRCRSVSLTVTNRRCIFRKGFLKNQTSEVLIQDIKNIQVNQGFTDRMLGVGELSVSSSGQSDIEIRISNIKDPQLIADLINSQRFT